MKRKGSLRRIPPDTKRLIAAHIMAPESRGKGRNVLAGELESKLGNESPSLETMMRMISRMRNTANPLDEPWSMASLLTWPLNPDAVAKILEWKTGSIDGRFRQISIRTALWFSRPCSLSISVDLLYLYASMYSESEQTSQISNTELRTEYLDYELFKTLKNPAESSWDLDDGYGTETGKRIFALMTTYHLHRNDHPRPIELTPEIIEREKGKKLQGTKERDERFDHSTGQE